MNNTSSERLNKIRYETFAETARGVNASVEVNASLLVAVLDELLALREAGKEPLAWISERNLSNLGKQFSVYVKHEPVMVRPVALYAAPQLPVVPMQPLEIDTQGTLRFRQNAIVRKLLDHSTAHGYGLNEMALDDYSADDRMQLAQLIGYSLSGYGTLSYVTDESYDRAIAAAPKPE